MKKLSILLLVFLVPFTVFSQFNIQTEEYPLKQYSSEGDFFILDSIISRSLPPNDSVIQEKKLFTYYDDGLIKSQSYFRLVDDTSFSIMFRIEYEYDQEERMSIYKRTCFPGYYKPSVKYVTNWFDQSYFVERIIYHLSDSLWIPYQRIYSPNIGQTDTILSYFFTWNLGNNQWDTTRYDISYLNVKNLVYFIKKYFKNTSNWQLIFTDSITYNAIDDTLQIIENGEVQTVFEYNEQGLITRRRLYIDWDIWYEKQWRYNSNNLLWKYYTYSRIPPFPDINGGIVNEYFYNENNTVDYRLTFSDSGNPYKKEFYYYSEFFVDIDKKNYLELKNFPNPFSSSTTIEYELTKPSTVQLTIYDFLGKQVEVIERSQAQGKQQIIWNAEGMPAGVYFYNIQIGNQAGTGKMVLMR